MKNLIDAALDGRAIRLRLTAAAEKALAERTQPLYAEMELYFSCLIRKKVRFYEVAESELYVPVSDKLELRFRPVMTARCHIGEVDEAPPLTDFPIDRGNRFIPHWLTIDYHNGEWQGDFGY